MNTYYIPVHYYERGDADDIVMLVTRRDIEKNELNKLLIEEVSKYRRRMLPCTDDLVHDVFNALVKRIGGGVWSYCDTLPTVTVGAAEPQNEDEERQLIQVATMNLAALLIMLNTGETLDFYTYNEDTGETDDAYGVTVINEFDSHVILINHYGGGLAGAIDITCYDTDLKRIRDDLLDYFQYIDKGSAVCINAKDIAALERRVPACQ